jgi:hypothetical protein
MTPLDLLARLKAEGIYVCLKLRLDGNAPPSAEMLELIQRHRDDLIIHLSTPLGDTPQMCRLSEQMQAGAVWCKRCYRYQMHPCSPTDKRIEGVN